MRFATFIAVTLQLAVFSQAQLGGPKIKYLDCDAAQKESMKEAVAESKHIFSRAARILGQYRPNDNKQLGLRDIVTSVLKNPDQEDLNYVVGRFDPE
jgi:hypothetical protein